MCEALGQPGWESEMNNRQDPRPALSGKSHVGNSHLYFSPRENGRRVRNTPINGKNDASVLVISVIQHVVTTH